MLATRVLIVARDATRPLGEAGAYVASESVDRYDCACMEAAICLTSFSAVRIW